MQQFRGTVNQSLRQRSDAFLDLLDALTVAGRVSSPVALSEETPFRRKFSSIFDTLRHAEIDFDLLLAALHTLQPADSQHMGRYEVHTPDTTPNERPEAQTLEDRGSLKAQKNDPVRYGHRYSWLVRLLRRSTSWAATVDLQRVDTEVSDSQVAGIQVQELD